MENLMALAGHAGALALSMSLSAALVRLCLHGVFSLLPTANQACVSGHVSPHVPPLSGGAGSRRGLWSRTAAKGLPRACKAGLNR